MEAGRDFGIAPYGTEALGVMRIEKGHVAGNEINGQTTARDLGLVRMLSTKKDYIGRVMAQRPGLLAADRPTFAGFKPVDRADRLRAGAHFIAEGAEPVAASDQGYMTSVAFSPTLGHWIGLGLLAGRAVAPRRARAGLRSRARRRRAGRGVRSRLLRSGRGAPAWVTTRTCSSPPSTASVRIGRSGRRTGDAGVVVSEVRESGWQPSQLARADAPLSSMRRAQPSASSCLICRDASRGAIWVSSGPAPISGWPAGIRLRQREWRLPWRGRSANLRQSSIRVMGARSCA
jgi:hypothetical protein